VGLLELMMSESQLRRAEVSSLRRISSAGTKTVGANDVSTAWAVNRFSAEVTSAIDRWGAAQADISVRGFTGLALQLEAQSGLLTSLDDALARPERTRARERRERGLFAYQKGLTTSEARWFVDATKEFTLAVDIDPYDYIPHMYLGTIATLQDGDDDRAAQAFADAAHYAWPDAPEASAIALVWRSALAFAAGRLDDAIEEASIACSRSPRLASPRIALGRAYLAAGRDADLEQCVRDALLADPSFETHFESDNELAHASVVRRVLEEEVASRKELLASLVSCLEHGADVLDAWEDWMCEIEESYYEITALPGVAMELLDLREEADSLRTTIEQLLKRVEKVSTFADAKALTEETSSCSSATDELLAGLWEALQVAEFGRGKARRHGVALLRAIDEVTGWGNSGAVV
jgi:tetratricopeptide (TPR) repeat protein